jgi:6-pyruvoyltetrahydropterin/6-carboxytetrahydropterin synthase
MTEFEITKAAAFDAAHFLPDGPTPSYRRMHGHSFRVEATLRGEVSGPVGWVSDLGAVERALNAAAGALDHGTLNEVAGLESPTLENLCLHFARLLKPSFPALIRITVSRPTVSESCSLTV